jgi:hypothetical protein
MVARGTLNLKNLVTIGAVGTASANTQMLAGSPMMGLKGDRQKNLSRRERGMQFFLRQRKGRKQESN